MTLIELVDCHFILSNNNMPKRRKKEAFTDGVEFDEAILNLRNAIIEQAILDYKLAVNGIDRYAGKLKDNSYRKAEYAEYMYRNHKRMYDDVIRFLYGDYFKFLCLGHDIEPDKIIDATDKRMIYEKFRKEKKCNRCKNYDCKWKCVDRFEEYCMTMDAGCEEERK